MENIVLIGAEDVRRAGSEMRAAAEQMTRAAAEITGALQGFREWGDAWLATFEQIVTNQSR